MSSTTRPPLERMAAIHRELQADRYPNCVQLGRRFEVSGRTVQRDLDYMRDRLGLPIDYDASRKGFRYTEAVEEFPTLAITEGEVVSLLVAQQALAQYRGTPYEQTLAKAFEKLTKGLRDVISFDLTTAHDRISFLSVGTYAADVEVFRELSRATMGQWEVEFAYRKPEGGKAEPRRVRPYHLACVRNLWYLLGHDNDRGALRTFALPRITELKVTKTKFERPGDFSAEAHFRDGFGIYAGGKKPQAVVLEFDAHAAGLIRERFWHASQKMKPLAGGGLKMTLKLAHFEDIEGWILGWGRHVRVLGPDYFIEHIRANLRATLQLYQKRRANPVGRTIPCL